MLKQFGTNYGGFYYPTNLDGLDKNSIIYCVGAGEDISHDIEIAKKLHSNVYIFDPTPKSIDHVNFVKDVMRGTKKPINNKRYGGGDPKYWDKILYNRIDPNKVIFETYGLYTRNDTLKFYKPTNNNYVSHSVVDGMKSKDFIIVEVKDLQTIMKKFNHTTIDLLKIDIEGCECDVLEKMLDDKIKPKYLSVDFDLGWHGERIKDRERCMKVIERLQTEGYKILHNEGSDYSFSLV